MPNPSPSELLFERFIETDDVVVASDSNARGEQTSQGHVSWKGESRWLEVTVGVIGLKGSMHAFNPSITVKETGGILSLEEKFQGAASCPSTLFSFALFNLLVNCREEWLSSSSFSTLSKRVEGSLMAWWVTQNSFWGSRWVTGGTGVNLTPPPTSLIK